MNQIARRSPRSVTPTLVDECLPLVKGALSEPRKEGNAARTLEQARDPTQANCSMSPGSPTSTTCEVTTRPRAPFKSRC
jgi:hypothetical protein